MLENDAALQMADEIRQDRKQAEAMLLNYAEELKIYRLKREEYVRGGDLYQQTGVIFLDTQRRQRLCVA